MQTVGIVKVLTSTQADETVVSLAMLLLNKVHIVGGYKLDVVFTRKLYKILVYMLLFGKRIVCGIGFVGLMALHLEVKVFTKKVLEPLHSLLGLCNVAFHYKLRYLASYTCRATDDAFMILFENVVVETTGFDYIYCLGMNTNYDNCYVTTSYAGARQFLPKTTFTYGGDTPQPQGIRGDVDGDELVTVSDATALIDILLSGGVAPATADANLDTEIGIADVTAIIDFLLSGTW